MSLHSYEVSRELSRVDRPFSSYIMAAMRKADSHNTRLLAAAFPGIWQELQARGDAPGGLLPDELEHAARRFAGGPPSPGQVPGPRDGDGR